MHQIVAASMNRETSDVQVSVGVEVSTAPGPPRRRRDSWRIDRGPTVGGRRAAAVDTFMFMALRVAPP